MSKFYEMDAMWPNTAQFEEVREAFFDWLDRVTGESHSTIFWVEYEAEAHVLEWCWYLKNDDGNFYVDPANSEQPAQDRTRQEVAPPPDEVLERWGVILTIIKGQEPFQKSG